LILVPPGWLAGCCGASGTINSIVPEWHLIIRKLFLGRAKGAGAKTSARAKEQADSSGNDKQKGRGKGKRRSGFLWE
jgi:hypothetical protein